MKKLLSLTFVSAVALALAASSADAATKKKGSKAKAAKPAAAKVQPVFVSHFNGCVGAFGPWAPVGAVGCGAVYAVPVIVEGIMLPRA